ncbi:MAG: four helix bundle protein [Ruminococcaceae bacterium]|nr:four helix bundle protein [Oscillospiraceae bacterium]
MRKNFVTYDGKSTVISACDEFLEMPSNQIGRSGTSIGANIHEAQYAQGTKDFISKFEIALKEASETGYWLELLYRTKYIDEQTFKTLSSKCTSLRVMLIASCKTAKENIK